MFIIKLLCISNECHKVIIFFLKKESFLQKKCLTSYFSFSRGVFRVLSDRHTKAPFGDCTLRGNQYLGVMLRR